MFLAALFHQIYISEFETLQDDEEYQTVKTSYTDAERELVFSMTKKQRRMFHECMRQRERVTTMELKYFLSRYALLIPPKG